MGACAIFMGIGTSGQVYPAADFVDVARTNRRAHTVELNLEPTALTHLFDEHVHGPASQVVPEYVDRLLRAGC